MNLYEKLNRLDDTLVESKKVVKKKKLTEGISKGSLIRWLKDHADQDIPNDDFNTLVNNLWNVIEKENEERKFYKMGYKSIEEVDVPQLIDSSDNPVHDIGYRLLGWSDYDDEMDEMLTESTEQYELSTLVKDSINHLVNDLGKDPMADDFGDDVCTDLENNYDIDVPQNPVKYADWCDAVMSEVSRQLNNKEELTENRNNPYFTPYGYKDAAKVLNRKAPEYYYHLKEIEMDRGDGVKLARYAMRKGLPVMVDKNSDPDYPEFAIKGEYHWNDYFYPYPTAHEEDLIAWDGKMFVEEAFVEGASEVYYLQLFSKNGRTFEQSFSTYQEAEEEGNFSLENNPMTKEYIIYDKNHKRIKHKR